jgi:serine phosphatase RsbU (regulator of sigma subunit)
VVTTRLGNPEQFAYFFKSMPRASFIFKFIKTVFIAAFFTASVQAQVIHLYDTSGIRVIGRSISLLEDTGGTLTVAQVASPMLKNRFSQGRTDIPNYNVTRSKVWSRITFINHSATAKWYLECSNPNVKHVDFYQATAGGKFVPSKSGFGTLAGMRDIKVHHLLFRLVLPKDSLVTCYVCMYDILPLQVHLSVGNSERFIERYEAQDAMHGAFFGLLFMLVIYNIFIFFSVKDKVYLFYVLYVIANAWFISFLTGYGIYLPSFIAAVLQNHPALVTYFLGAASCLFNIIFLDMKRTYRKGYRITLFMFFLLLVIPVLDFSGRQVEAILLVQLLGLIFSVVSFIFGWIIWRRGYRSAKFYLLGWSAYLVGLILHISADLRLIPFNAFTHNSLEIFTAVEAILLSMAVGEKISIFKKEKEQAQQETLAAAQKNEQLVREQNVVLNQKVKERTLELEEQKKIIEEKNKEIVDSITYARRIQYALLAHENVLKRNLPGHFVLFRPKDIVSGDFYWASEKNDRFYLAVCDSTGHGVPGAFMSLLNISYLNEAINEGINEPNAIFDHVRNRLIEDISQDGGQDGMDAILLAIDRKSGNIHCAAANNALVIVRNGHIIHYPADKMPIGKGENLKAFNLLKLEVSKGDMVYLYTDGFADQFGGPRGKKFKYRHLEEWLVSVAPLPLKEQKEILEKTFLDWKGALEQVDDVSVIGFRI